MSDKPISFKASKPKPVTTNVSLAEDSDKADKKIVEEPKTEQTSVVDSKPNTTQTEDWESKIAAAKAEEKVKQETTKAEEDSIAAAAARIAGEQNATTTVKVADPVKEEKKETVTVTVADTENMTEKKSDSDDDEAFATYWDSNAGTDAVEGNADYVPTEEDKKRAEVIKDSKEANASHVLSCQLGSENEFIKAFNFIKEFMDKQKNLSEEDLEAHPEVKDVIQWAADLQAINEMSLNTDQQRLLLGMISALNKNNKFLAKLDRKLSLSKVTAGLQSDGQPKLLRGSTAMQIINNRYRGVYKIQLHNSGFWIKVVPLRNVDVDAWMQEVDFERKQIGRIVGGHFYLGMNIYLKEKMADLLKLATVDSNLENWTEGTTLVDSISIHDYDTLCWAFATMMHKDGVKISTVCVNPDCKHHNESQFLDLARCAYINPDVYTEEAMQFMLAGNAPGVIRTQKDIKNYKEKLLKNIRVIKFTDTDQYELRDPSLGEFIRVGMSTLGKLAAQVKDGKLTNDSEEVRRYSVYHLTKMFSPWISKIILNDEAGKCIGVIDDRDAITKSLETTMDDEYHVIKNIEEFMTNSKVSFYTTVSLRCEKCGHQPNLLKDNIFPLDVEYVLFCLSYLKLEQIGVTL